MVVPLEGAPVLSNEFWDDCVGDVVVLEIPRAVGRTVCVLRLRKERNWKRRARFKVGGTCAAAFACDSLAASIPMSRNIVE